MLVTKKKLNKVPKEKTLKKKKNFFVLNVFFFRGEKNSMYIYVQKKGENK